MNASPESLIVGSGLAGSILAYRLMERGERVLLIDDPCTPSASRVAAGLINPVTGQRLVLQKNIETLLASAHQLYHHLEVKFGRKLLHDREMLRVIRNDNETTAWQKRKSDPAYTPYLGDYRKHDDFVNAPNGLFSQHHTGFLDTNALLDLLHLHFRDQNMMVSAKVNHDDISIVPEGVRWQAIEAKRIIFCEGWRGSLNPWFKHLPFQSAKGEIMTLITECPLPEHIINSGNWIIPIDQQRFKLGASYDWNQLDENITDSACEELIAALNKMVVHPLTCSVLEHKAGIRPGSRDKQLFIGFHAKHPLVGIFNGLGSKGSLLTPWYSDMFARHITDGDALPDDANIARFDG